MNFQMSLFAVLQTVKSMYLNAQIYFNEVHINIKNIALQSTFKLDFIMRNYSIRIETIIKKSRYTSHHNGNNGDE